MPSRVSVVAVGLFSALGASGLSAAPRTMADCRALADSAARLACYDMLDAQPSAAPAAPAMPLPAAPAAAPQRLSAPPGRDYTHPAASAAPSPARRSDFDSRIAAVTPQRHGYYRLMLEDGSTYLTTAVAPPPEVGAEVHIRRTFVGTTYLDTKGRDPIAIRLARQQ